MVDISIQRTSDDGGDAIVEMATLSTFPLEASAVPETPMDGSWHPIAREVGLLLSRFPAVTEHNTMRKMLLQELEERPTEIEKMKVWNESAEVVKAYHDELVRRWQAEMDNILIYVSAILLRR